MASSAGSVPPEQPLFRAVASSTRQIYQLLKCISFTTKVHVQITQEGLKFTADHKSLHLRLSPLQSVLKDLERRLGAGSQDPVSMDDGPGVDAAPFNSSNGGYGFGREGITIHTYNAASLKRKPTHLRLLNRQTSMDPVHTPPRRSSSPAVPL